MKGRWDMYMRRVVKFLATRRHEMTEAGPLLRVLEREMGLLLSREMLPSTHQELCEFAVLEYVKRVAWTGWDVVEKVDLLQGPVGTRTM